MDKSNDRERGALEGFRRLLGILKTLRGPGGCPWDRKQTERSMAPQLLEEAFETADAIHQGDPAKTAEELGDLSMNVLMICLIAEETERFTAEEVFHRIAEKLIRRHPHVFGDKGPMEEKEFLHLWEDLKKGERQARHEDDSALAGIPSALPALQRALRMVEKIGRSGIHEPGLEDFEGRMSRALDSLRAPHAGGSPEARMGDLLLNLVQWCAERRINPEMALREQIGRAHV